MTPKSPEKVYVYVPLLLILSQETRHINFFLGGPPKWGVLGGGQKVYVEKVYALFLSINCGGADCVPKILSSQVLGAKLG